MIFAVCTIAGNADLCFLWRSAAAACLGYLILLRGTLLSFLGQWTGMLLPGSLHPTRIG